jgi:hypothetical protein
VCAGRLPTTAKLSLLPLLQKDEPSNSTVGCDCANPGDAMTCDEQCKIYRSATTAYADLQMFLQVCLRSVLVGCCFCLPTFYCFQV